jgi:hypothetical protein
MTILKAVISAQLYALALKIAVTAVYLYAHNKPMYNIGSDCIVNLVQDDDHIFATYRPLQMGWM